MLKRAIQKLLNEIKGRWGEKKVEMSPKGPSLQDLNIWLGARVRAKASVSDHQTNRGPPKTSPRPDSRGGRKGQTQRRPNNLSPSVSMLVPGVQDTKKTPIEGKRCLICSQSHQIENCETVRALDVNDRAQLAKEKKLCFRCLSDSEHLARKCNRRGRCEVENCNKLHHPLIHGAAPVFIEYHHSDTRQQRYRFRSYPPP